mmetsp:Transcript_13932/g.35969  ORF Transcript_13932/g.35969 Transcript_13932/m.35969 type:complete len:322 (-) Transcript_13932:537-1502(-)
MPAAARGALWCSRDLGTRGGGIAGSDGTCLVPVRLGDDLLAVAPVDVLGRDLLHLCEETLCRVESDRVEAERAELLVLDVELVLGVLLPRVGDARDLRIAHARDNLRYVAHARRLGNLVKDLHWIARVRRVVNGKLDAAARVGDVDEGARLAAGAVDGERDAARRLHQEAVEHRAVVTIIVEAVAEALVLGRQRSVRAPHDALVEIGQPQEVVLGVELEEERVEALGRVVDRSGIRRVQDLLLPVARQDHVNVTLRDLAARVAVPVHAHRSEVDKVDVEPRVDDGSEHVVCRAEVVLDCVTLRRRVLHRVGRRTLLSKVND